jgi:hypothetical protein
MDQAVAVEDYKQAAKVRDQFKVGRRAAARCSQAPGQPQHHAGPSGTPLQPGCTKALPSLFLPTR